MGDYRIEGSVRIADAGSSFPNGRGDFSVARDARVSGVANQARTVTTFSATGNLTGAQIIGDETTGGGIIQVNTTAGAVTLTLPTEAAFVAAMANAAVGDVVSCLIFNYTTTADGTNLVTINNSTNGMVIPDASNDTITIATGRGRTLFFRVSTVTTALDTVTVY